MQPQLFVAPSFDRLLEDLIDWVQEGEWSVDGRWCFDRSPVLPGSNQEQPTSPVGLS